MDGWMDGWMYYVKYGTKNQYDSPLQVLPIEFMSLVAPLDSLFPRLLKVDW